MGGRFFFQIVLIMVLINLAIVALYYILKMPINTKEQRVNEIVLGPCKVTLQRLIKVFFTLIEMVEL